jgi:chorismate synthase
LRFPGRVAAGAVAEKWLKDKFGIEIIAWVSSVGDISIGSDNPHADMSKITRADVDKTLVRCPDPVAAEKMAALISSLKDQKDSIGGVVSCVCRNVPAGWGEPCFDKLEAMLGHAMLSIPATKGFEIGSGFEGTKMRGSKHNDPFVKKEDGQLGTVTNNSGGIQGGISNGESIYFRIAFKPPATIGLDQQTSDIQGNDVTLAAKGRHDPCVVPRAISIVEAMAALVLADAAALQMSRKAAFVN